MDKTSYEKGMKDGFKKCAQIVRSFIRECERDPKDPTRLSMKVTAKLNELCD